MQSKSWDYVVQSSTVGYSVRFSTRPGRMSACSRPDRSKRYQRASAAVHMKDASQRVRSKGGNCETFYVVRIISETRCCGGGVATGGSFLRDVTPRSGQRRVE